MSVPDDTDSWEAPLLRPGRWDKPLWSPAPVKIDAAGLSHAGFVRSNNEDHYLIARFGRFLQCVDSNLAAQDAPARHEAMGSAFLVADGMGGTPPAKRRARQHCGFSSTWWSIHPTGCCASMSSD